MDKRTNPAQSSLKAKVTTLLTSTLNLGIAEEDRMSKHFHASGLRKCGRQQVLELMGFENNHISKPEWRRAAMAGDAIHDMVTDIAKAQGILESAEAPIEVDPKFFVSGRIDAILNRNGDRRVLEIKSKNTKKFKTFYPGDKGFEDAYAQLQWYLFALHLEGGFILAVERDSLIFREFSVMYDDSYILSLQTRAMRLKICLDNASPPPPERNNDDCYFCGFKGTDQCCDVSNDDLF